MSRWCPICALPYTPAPLATQTIACSPRCFRALLLQPDTTRSLLLRISAALQLLDAGQPGASDLLRDGLLRLGDDPGPLPAMVGGASVEDWTPADPYRGNLEVVACMRRLRNWQRRHRCHGDGLFGPHTWTARNAADVAERSIVDRIAIDLISALAAAGLSDTGQFGWVRDKLSSARAVRWCPQCHTKQEWQPGSSWSCVGCGAVWVRGGTL